jgi:signal transduction histidine kinase
MKQEGEIPKVTFIALSKTGDLIILTKPMKGISDSVLIANQFTVLVGLMIILLGGVLMSLLANTLTKPVRSMNQVTKEIAELDFTHRVDVNTHDELGELADNINTISVKLNDSVQNLRTDIQRRKQLARDMSHELKTPISSIKGYAEGLARGIADTPEKTDHYIKVIVNECDRMDLIVRHLLDLSRLEDASIHLNKAPLLLDDLFDALKTQVEAYVTENGYTLSFANAGPLSITADKEQLKKALLNFITNAVLYGGREKQIRCYVQQEENNLDLIVFNTGDPIDEADLPKLFNLFYKVDKARTREAGGHGIGLAIVKQIAELHQGQAFARNTINGVEFILRIPA